MPWVYWFWRSARLLTSDCLFGIPGARLVLWTWHEFAKTAAGNRWAKPQTVRNSSVTSRRPFRYVLVMRAQYPVHKSRCRPVVLVFLYYSNFVVRQTARAEPPWGIATAEYKYSKLFAFFAIARWISSQRMQRIFEWQMATRMYSFRFQYILAIITIKCDL